MPRLLLYRSTLLFSLFLLVTGIAGSLLLGQEPAAGAVIGGGNDHYQALRTAGPGESFTVQELTLKRDVGLIRLDSGTVTFLTPVLDRVTMAVFSGNGTFILEPGRLQELRNLVLLTGEKSVQEPFQQAVFWFTDATEREIREQGSPGTATQAEDVLRKFRSQMRKRREEPRTVLEAQMTSEAMDNVESR